MTNEPIARYFDRECCAAGPVDVGMASGLDGLSETLLAALAQAGFRSGTVLEVGSGDGALSRELIRRGAKAVTGLDLSPQSVSHARARAESAGTADRLTYSVADASSAPLSAHDAVISEKVFCCYPDAAGLLANTLGAARSNYALALPESRGLFGLVSRVLIAAENLWRFLWRDDFRAYVHDIRLIDRTIRAAGFELRSTRRRGLWRVLAYSRY